MQWDNMFSKKVHTQLVFVLLLIISFLTYKIMYRFSTPINAADTIAHEKTVTKPKKKMRNPFLYGDDPDAYYFIDED